MEPITCCRWRGCHAVALFTIARTFDRIVVADYCRTHIRPALDDHRLSGPPAPVAVYALVPTSN